MSLVKRPQSVEISRESHEEMKRLYYRGASSFSIGRATQHFDDESSAWNVTELKKLLFTCATKTPCTKLTLNVINENYFNYLAIYTVFFHQRLFLSFFTLSPYWRYKLLRASVRETFVRIVIRKCSRYSFSFKNSFPCVLTYLLLCGLVTLRVVCGSPNLNIGVEI